MEGEENKTVSAANPTEPAGTEGATSEKAKVPTQEEIDTRIAQAKEQGKKEAEETYKGIQRVIELKNEEIKRLKTKQVSTTGSQAQREIIRKLAEQYQDDPAIRQAVNQLDVEDQRAIQETISQQWRDKFDQKIRDAGLDPSDETFEDVNTWFDITKKFDGEFDRVERKLDKILKARKTQMPSEPEKKQEQVKETDEQVKARIKQELLKDESFRREVLQSMNLTQEKVVPSSGGRVFSRKELAGMPISEYEKIKPEVDKARREGRIKD